MVIYGIYTDVAIAVKYFAWQFAHNVNKFDAINVPNTHARIPRGIRNQTRAYPPGCEHFACRVSHMHTSYPHTCMSEIDRASLGWGRIAGANICTSRPLAARSRIYWYWLSRHLDIAGHRPVAYSLISVPGRVVSCCPIRELRRNHRQHLYMLMCAFRRKLITIDNTSILLCVQCVYMGSLVLINYRMCLRIAVCRLIVVVCGCWSPLACIAIRIGGVHCPWCRPMRCCDTRACLEERACIDQSMRRACRSLIRLKCPWLVWELRCFSGNYCVPVYWRGRWRIYSRSLVEIFSNNAIKVNRLLVTISNYIGNLFVYE